MRNVVHRAILGLIAALAIAMVGSASAAPVHTDRIYPFIGRGWLDFEDYWWYPPAVVAQPEILGEPSAAVFAPAAVMVAPKCRIALIHQFRHGHMVIVRRKVCG